MEMMSFTPEIKYYPLNIQVTVLLNHLMMLKGFFNILHNIIIIKGDVTVRRPTTPSPHQQPLRPSSKINRHTLGLDEILQILHP